MQVLNLYRFLIVALCLYGFISEANAQEKSSFSYIRQIEASADDKNYIYLYHSKGGVTEQYVHLHKYQQKQIATVIYKDSVLGELIIDEPNLFNYVKSNIKLFKIASQYQHKNPKKQAQFSKDFRNPQVLSLQLGIRTEGLHYNHFIRTSPEYIASIKKQKVRDAYKAVNHVIEILEYSIAKGAAFNR